MLNEGWMFFSQIQERLTGKQKFRIQEIKERLENIKNRLHNLKIVITQTSSGILSSNEPLPINEEMSGKKWCQPETGMSLIDLFSPESSQNARVLEECEPELDFSQFDKFRKNGVKSKSLYSNPEFFLQEYMSTAEITKKKKPTNKVVKQIARPIHTKPSPKKKISQEIPLPPTTARKESMPLPPDMETRSSIPPPPSRDSHTEDPRSSIPQPPPGLPPGMASPTAKTKRSIPTPPPGLPPSMSSPVALPRTPDEQERRKSSISETMPGLPPSSPDHLPPRTSVEQIEPEFHTLPTESFETHPPVAPDMPSLDKDDEEDQQKREGAINNLLEEIKKQKTKQKKVKTVHDEDKSYENPFEAAIRNVNRSKLRKVKTRDESKMDNTTSDFTTSQSKGLFDVLALRTAMHEESEEEVAVDDEDWT